MSLEGGEPLCESLVVYFNFLHSQQKIGFSQTLLIEG